MSAGPTRVEAEIVEGTGGAPAAALPAVVSPLDPAVIDMERALSMLAGVGQALASPELDPRQLNDLRAHIDALVGLLQRVGRSTVLANAGIAYRIQTERRIGQHLNTLDAERGRRHDGQTELQRAVQDELRISYRTALRWREIGAADQEVVDGYVGPALDALERSNAGDDPLDEHGDPQRLLSTATLLRLLHTAQGSGTAASGDAAGGARATRDDDDDDDAGLFSLDLPDALFAASERGARHDRPVRRRARYARPELERSGAHHAATGLGRAVQRPPPPALRASRGERCRAGRGDRPELPLVAPLCGLAALPALECRARRAAGGPADRLLPFR